MCTATRYIISAAMAIPDDNETYLKTLLNVFIGKAIIVILCTN